MQIHLTDACNKNCFHCYNRFKSNTSNLDPDILIRVIPWFIEYFRSNSNILLPIVYSGGDPILYPHLERLLSTFSNHPQMIMLNSESVTDEWINLLKKNNIVKVQFSIDGLEETHDTIRGKGDFSRTLICIEQFLNLSIPVNIMFTLSKMNSSDLIPLLIYLSKRFKTSAPTFAFARIVPMNKSESNIMLEKYEFIDLCHQYISLKLEFLKNKNRIILKLKDSMLAKMWDSLFPNNRAENSCCLLGKTIGIMSDGGVTPCIRTGISMFNIKDIKSLKDLSILMQRHFIPFKDKDKFSAILENKCIGCPAISQAYFEDYRMLDPQLYPEEIR